MAAGIVASTLRRRTLRQKMTIEAKYQAIEPGHISLSPTASHPPSRSPSFMRHSMSRSPSGSSQKGPRFTKLFYQDFWPACINPAEQNLKLVEFETFEWVFLHFILYSENLFDHLNFPIKLMVGQNRMTLLERKRECCKKKQTLGLWGSKSLIPWAKAASSYSSSGGAVKVKPSNSQRTWKIV